MSDETAASEAGTANTSHRIYVKEARYSLKTMMDEVQSERRGSTLVRELVDSTEIGKMFATRKRKKK